jgi:hypothetical protein
VGLAQGHIAEAYEEIETCAAYLTAHRGDGMEFPVVAYLSCHDVLQAADRPHAARWMLDEAHELLMGIVASISDPAMREGLLGNVAANRRVLAEWEATQSQRTVGAAD